MDLATREGFTQFKLTDLTPGKNFASKRPDVFVKSGE